MSKKTNLLVIKEILAIILISMLGILSIVFSVLYINTFDSGFFNNYSTLIITVTTAIISVLTVLCITFLSKSNKIIYKLFFLTIITITIVLILLYTLKTSGFLSKFDSVEKFRNYINSFGSLAVVLFIIIQFLQVVVLPIPSFITVGAGVLLFGAFKGALFSVIGIILGSLVAFFLGRIFGVKVVKWLVGENALRKGLNVIKGKDKIVLTFMFLFPFFPDDVLCFVSGITTMSPCFFIIMIFITRIITVFISSYSMNNNIIPYDTWWGILLWIIFFMLTTVLTICVYKYGEKIEDVFKRKKQAKH